VVSSAVVGDEQARAYPLSMTRAATSSVDHNGSQRNELWAVAVGLGVDWRYARHGQQ